MKKLLTLTAIGATLTAPATAVQKCVALGTTTEAISTEANQEELEWSVKFPNITVEGIGVCTDTTGTEAQSRKYMTLSVSDPDSYSNCWCKMTAPAVSQWVFAENIDNWVACYMSCSYACASYFTDDGSRFREVMLNSLSN